MWQRRVHGLSYLNDLVRQTLACVEHEFKDDFGNFSLWYQEMQNTFWNQDSVTLPHNFFHCSVVCPRMLTHMHRFNWALKLTIHPIGFLNFFYLSHLLGIHITNQRCVSCGSTRKRYWCTEMRYTITVSIETKFVFWYFRLNIM